MRPIRLKMSAFGSYTGTVVIDFENGLQGERIFLIHGATGSGKTTILDAICFALYGVASGSDRDGNIMRSKNVSSEFPTKVEFSFALGDKVYTVCRTPSYEIPKKNGGVKLIPATAEIICVGERLETQNKNVTRFIENLLGFTAKQFRQVVLLPQGEFENFLFAKADERQTILNAIFNANFYERIEKGLKIRMEAHKKILDDLEREKKILLSQFQNIMAEKKSEVELKSTLELVIIKVFESKKLLDDALNKLNNGKFLEHEFEELERRTLVLNIAIEDHIKSVKEFSRVKDDYNDCIEHRSRREGIQNQIYELKQFRELVNELNRAKKKFSEAKCSLTRIQENYSKIRLEQTDYEDQLEFFKNQIQAIGDADKRFERTNQLLEKVNNRETLLKEIAQTEKILSFYIDKNLTNEKNCKKSKERLDRLRQLQFDGNAKKLADSLQDGQPCPVCGSVIHHKIKFDNKIVPSDNEMNIAEQNFEHAQSLVNDTKQKIAELNGKLTEKNEFLKSFSDLPNFNDIETSFITAKKDADNLNFYREQVQKVEKRLKDNKRELEMFDKNLLEARNLFANVSGEIKTIERKIPEEYFIEPLKIESKLVAAEEELLLIDKNWEDIQRKFIDANNKKSSCEIILKTARDFQKELAERLKVQTTPNISELQSEVNEAQKNYESALCTEAKLRNDINALEKISVCLAELDQKISDSIKKFNIWKKLSDVATGNSGGLKISFARYYLGAMFNSVIIEANRRLQKMSNCRYQLRLKDAGKRADSTAGINIEIFDEYSGTTRSIATLSGGERFLTSLALAFGLMATIHNNLGGMRLDTIFIDEGFGLLDNETLDLAISTIIEQSGGRIVGIISHVEELKYRIPIRLEVVRDRMGSNVHFIH